MPAELTGIYQHLNEALIARANRPIFALVVSEERQPDHQTKTLESLAELHNRLNGLRSIYGQDVPVIFDSQEQYAEMAEKGLLVLSPNQATVALHALQGEATGEQVQRALNGEINNKIKFTEQEKDLAGYLLWQMEQRHYYHIQMVDSAIYRTVSGQEPYTLQDYVDDIESRKPKWITEARLVKRMHLMLSDLPDEDKIKVVILRMPENVDRSRSPRVLTYFPPHAFYGMGGQANNTNPEALTTYCLTNAACIHHSFDVLYRLTRIQKPGGQYEARAFYVTSQSAEGTNMRFLEVSFADGRPPIPPIRTEYPQLAFRRNSAIEMIDLAPNLLVGKDGELHFILGVDEYGNNITQDVIPYAVDSLVGGPSNVHNIRVDQLLQP